MTLPIMTIMLSLNCLKFENPLDWVRLIQKIYNGAYKRKT